MGKVEVTNVQIVVNGNEFNLTIKEAMELKQVLNDTFPEKEFVPVPYSVPYIVPQTIWIEKPDRRWNDWQITWIGNICESDVSQTIPGTVCLSNSG